MPDHAERELQGRIERDNCSGGISIVSVQEVLDSNVREKSEAAGEAVFEDDTEAESRDEIIGIQDFEGVLGIGEAESVGPAEPGVKLRVEGLVDFAQGGIVEDSIHEGVCGTIGIGIEFPLIRRAGAGIVAVTAADAQGPSIVEIVSEGQRAVAGDGIPAPAVVEERADVVIKTDLGTALSGEEPAMPVLIG